MLLMPMQGLDISSEEMTRAVQRESQIVGREREIRKALAALLAGKHLLIEGPVGVGKTALAMAVSKYLKKPFYRVDGDERYTEQKLAGWFDPPLVMKKGYVRETFLPGPLAQAMVNAGILFINEMNRMPEAVQNVLLPSMDEGRIEVPHIGTISSKEGFVVIASQNPKEFVGTGNISEALRDRFELIQLSFQTQEDEEAIVKLRTGISDSELVRFSVLVGRASREHQALKRGASVRAAVSISSLASYHQGELVDRIREAAHMALPTRIELKEDAGKNVHEIIDEIVSSVFSGSKDENRGNDEGKPGPSSEAFFRKQDQKLVGAEQSVSDLLAKASRILGKQFRPEDDTGSIIARDLHHLAPWLTSYELEMAREMAVKATFAKILSVLGPLKHPMKKLMEPYRYGASGEIDLDETIEKIAEGAGKTSSDFEADKDPNAEDIILSRKEVKKFACSLILDASLSMSGEKIALAAATLGVLSVKMRMYDFAVVIFQEKASVIKAMGERKPIKSVLLSILDTPSMGYTNISDALEKGWVELGKAPVSDKFGIIVTDGYYTVGSNPGAMASRYPALFVIMISSDKSTSNPRVCQEMARAGYGQVFSVKTLEEIPTVIRQTLKEVSSRA